MSAPITWCEGCGSNLGGLWGKYIRLLDDDFVVEEVLTMLGLELLCCRNKMTTYRNHGRQLTTQRAMQYINNDKRWHIFKAELERQKKQEEDSLEQCESPT